LLALLPTLLALALALLAAGVVLAARTTVQTHQVTSGGITAASASGGDVHLGGTLGQPVVGIVTSDGGDVSLGQGFWHGGDVAVMHEIYLPLLLRNF
jgi:hypothetical protein